MSDQKIRVLWDNGHASDLLPGVYDTVEEAEEAGRNWKIEMVAIDPKPEEAEEAYSWETILDLRSPERREEEDKRIAWYIPEEDKK